MSDNGPSYVSSELGEQLELEEDQPEDRTGENNDEDCCGHGVGLWLNGQPMALATTALCRSAAQSSPPQGSAMPRLWRMRAHRTDLNADRPQQVVALRACRIAIGVRDTGLRVTGYPQRKIYSGCMAFLTGGDLNHRKPSLANCCKPNTQKSYLPITIKSVGIECNRLGRSRLP